MLGCGSSCPFNSKGRHPGGILIRCPVYLSWLPFYTKEQQLFTELPTNVPAPYPISKTEHSHLTPHPTTNTTNVL